MERADKERRLALNGGWIKVGAWAALCACFGAGGAPAGTCRAQQQGEGSVIVDDAGTHVEYRLTVRDPRWEMSAFGHHANALVSCENCNPGKVEGGIIWMSAGDGTTTSPTLAEDTSFIGFVSGMWFSGYGGATPVPSGDQEAFEWSAYKGYARRFRGRSEAGGEVDLLLAAVTDGCFGLRFYTSVKGHRDAPPSSELRALMEGIEIRRTIVKALQKRSP